jgi:hypothetical protein
VGASPDRPRLQTREPCGAHGVSDVVTWVIATGLRDVIGGAQMRQPRPQPHGEVHMTRGPKFGGCPLFWDILTIIRGSGALFEARSWGKVGRMLPT